MPKVPNISKALPIIKWAEAFQDFLARVVHVQAIPLSYVIRADADVPAATPALAAGQPHSTEHGSVKDELVSRASHTHALFRDDNVTVYHHLDGDDSVDGMTFFEALSSHAKDGDFMMLIGLYFCQ